MATTNPNSIPPDGRPYHEQPQWRNDFPIDWPQDELVARRDFTKFLVVTSFAFVVGQVWIVFENWSRKRKGRLPIQKIGPIAAIPAGATSVFRYAGESCLLIRTGADRFVAYSQKCTHLSCAVTPTDRGLHCPCHNGWFNIATGEPFAGPPRRPLPRITLEIRNGILYATGVS